MSLFTYYINDCILFNAFSTAFPMQMGSPEQIKGISKLVHTELGVIVFTLLEYAYG